MLVLMVISPPEYTLLILYMRVSMNLDVQWSIPAKRLKCIFCSSLFVLGKISLVSIGKLKMDNKN